MKVYLISGKSHSGKTTCARVLDSKLTGQAQLINIADELKAIVSLYIREFYGVDYVFEDDTKDKTFQTPAGEFCPRILCQRLGSNVFRKYDEHFWSRRAIERVCCHAKVLIVGDVRFATEVEYFVCEYGRENVTLININRGKLNPIGASHKSEKGICRDDVDVFDIKYYEIDNSTDYDDGGVAFFSAELDRIIN